MDGQEADAGVTARLEAVLTGPKAQTSAAVFTVRELTEVRPWLQRTATAWPVRIFFMALLVVHSPSLKIQPIVVGANLPSDCTLHVRQARELRAREGMQPWRPELLSSSCKP